MALVLIGKTPCIKYFLVSSCSKNHCHMCHKLTVEPSADIISGIKQCIKSNAKVFEKNPKRREDSFQCHRSLETFYLRHHPQTQKPQAQTSGSIIFITLIT